jgi:nucleotide-binding universal stress UspA family protein
MSKRIVVGLDGSPHSANALRLALRRIKDYQGVLVGMAVIDQPTIERIAAGAQPGAFELTDRSVSIAVEHAKRRAQDLIAEFRSVCVSEGVRYEDVIHSGAPHEGLLEEGKTADLIVIGMHTFFYHTSVEDSLYTLGQLLKRPVCPVIAVPATMSTLPEHIIITYDGSPGAARAMQSYVRVTPNLPDRYDVTVLCVSRDRSETAYLIEKAVSYLRAHDIQPSIVVRDGPPADVILELAKEREPAIVTLGAPLYKGLVDRLFGSTMESVVRKETVPIFVHH